MAKRLRIGAKRVSSEALKVDNSDEQASIAAAEPTSDVDRFSREVIDALIKDSLPATPNNFNAYFERLLDEKPEAIKKQISQILEYENENEDEKHLEFEKSLKQGFTSIKNILHLTVNLYKNMNLMDKILDKKKSEIEVTQSAAGIRNIINGLSTDVQKLNTIVKKQVDTMKDLYDETAEVVKSVEQESIFDEQLGVYNKRHLLNKLDQEINLIKQFNHKSSLITVGFGKAMAPVLANEKAKMLMIRTVSRILMKTSRRSDIVAHYGNGVFAMLLKHSDMKSAELASDRLCNNVSNTNFFLGGREIKLKINVGVANVKVDREKEETIVAALDAMKTAIEDGQINYSVSLEDRE